MVRRLSILLIIVLLIGCNEPEKPKMQEQVTRGTQTESPRFYGIIKGLTQTNQPVADAFVFLDDEEKPYGTTDSTGSLIIKNYPVKNNEIEVVIYKQGVGGGIKTFDFPKKQKSNEVVELKIHLEENPPIKVQAKAFEKTVASDQRLVLPDATVYINGVEKGKTNSSGELSVVLREFSKRQIDVTVKLEGASFNPKHYLATQKSQTLPMRENDFWYRTDHDRFTFVKIPESTIHFTVSDGDTQQSLSGVEVKVDDVVKFTDEGGKASIRLFRQANATVKAMFSKDGYLSNSQSITFQSGTYEYPEEVSLITPTIVDVFVEDINGLPLSDVTVSINQTGSKTTTQGLARLTLGTFQSKQLVISKAGWRLSGRPQISPVNEEKHFTVRAEMDPHKQVTIHVTDGSESLSGVTIFEVEPDGRKDLGVTNENGQAEVTITTRNYKLLFSKYGYSVGELQGNVDNTNGTLKFTMRHDKVRVRIIAIAKDGDTEKEIGANVLINGEPIRNEDYQPGLYKVEVTPREGNYMPWKGFLNFDFDQAENGIFKKSVDVWKDDYREAKEKEAYDIDEAIKMYQKMENPEHPDFVKSHMRAGELLYGKRKYEEAAYEYLKIVKKSRFSNNAQAYYGLGLSLFYAGEKEGSIPYFENTYKYRSELPSDSDGKEALFYTLYHLGQANQYLANLATDLAAKTNYLMESETYWTKFLMDAKSKELRNRSEDYRKDYSRGEKRLASVKEKLNQLNNGEEDQ